MRIEKHRGLLSMWLALPVIILSATNLVALTQSLPSQPVVETPTSIASYYNTDSRPLAPASLAVSPEVLLPKDGYHPITPSQRFQWFVTSTLGPSHLVGLVHVGMRHRGESAGGVPVALEGLCQPFWRRSRWKHLGQHIGSWCRILSPRGSSLFSYVTTALQSSRG